MAHAPTPPTSDKPPMTKARVAGLSCLGCGGLVVVGLIFLLIIGLIFGSPSDPDQDSSSDSPTTTAAATSEAPTGAPTTEPSPESAPEEQEAGEVERDVDADQPATGEALAALETLEVKGRAPKTGYDREAQFGQAWKDMDRNGCDTRNDILNRDLTSIEHKPGTGGCKVTAGELIGPYTAKRIHFTAGRDTSRDVQIDHVVALSDAWQKGAQQIDQDAREHLANDPLNLLAVDGPTNAQKGDGDAATWLPPNKPFRCEYVARQVAVKATYHLWVTQPEKDAMIRVLNGCPGQQLPAREASPAVEEPAQEAPAAPEAPVEEAPAPAPEPAQPGGRAAYYPNCAAAKSAGAAPLYAGQPGYRSGLDRDGDGVACER